MLKYVFMALIMSCAVKKYNEPKRYDAVEKVELNEDWYHHLRTKQISESLCVEGLINRLRNWDCAKINVEKFDYHIEVECERRNNETRDTFWERNVFIVKTPVFTKNGLKAVNVYKNPTVICIDTLQSVEVVKFQVPNVEKVKIKK